MGRRKDYTPIVGSCVTLSGGQCGPIRRVGENADLTADQPGPAGHCGHPIPTCNARSRCGKGTCFPALFDVR